MQKYKIRQQPTGLKA